MDMMGRVGLIEIHADRPRSESLDGSHDQGRENCHSTWGNIEKGSLYSMFVRMLLHNAMEEQKRQEAMEAEDEDDE